MKKLILLGLIALAALSIPLFSESGGGGDEGEGSCYVTVEGHLIRDNLLEIQGCVNGQSGCTYNVSVPCP